MSEYYSYKYIYLIPLLLSAIFSLRCFGLKWPRQYRIFSFFLLLTLLAEITAVTWKKYLHQNWGYTNNNLWVYNAFHVIRYPLFILFYYKMLKPASIKRMISYVGPVIVFFSILDLFVIQGPLEMNNYTVVVTHIFSVVLSFLFFRQVMLEAEIVHLSTHPLVWISLGSLIYCSGAVPWFMIYNYALKFPNIAVMLWTIHNVLNIFLYTFYLIAFLCRPPK